MTFKITYMSYAGNVRHTTVDGIDKEDAINNAYKEESTYSGDNIFKIIDIEEQ